MEPGIVGELTLERNMVLPRLKQTNLESHCTCLGDVSGTGSEK